MAESVTEDARCQKRCHDYQFPTNGIQRQREIHSRSDSFAGAELWVWSVRSIKGADQNQQHRLDEFFVADKSLNAKVVFDFVRNALIMITFFTGSLWLARHPDALLHWNKLLWITKNGLYAIGLVLMLIVAGQGLFITLRAWRMSTEAKAQGDRLLRLFYFAVGWFVFIVALLLPMLALFFWAQAGVLRTDPGARVL